VRACPLAVPRSDSSSHPPKAAARLCDEMRACWAILDDLTTRLADASLPLRDAPQTSATLQEAQQRYESETRALLVEEAAAFLRLRPIRRSLEAIREYARESGGSGDRGRRRIDSQFEELLAETAMDLCEPWHIRLSGGDEAEWHEWDRRRAEHKGKADALLEKYMQWSVAIPPPDGAQNADGAARLETLWREQRAISAFVEMELAFHDIVGVWLQETGRLAASLKRERETVLGIARQTIQWIRDSACAGSPPEKLAVAPPGERLRDWSQRIEEEAEQRLPERVELVEPHGLPHWRSMAARSAFLEAFRTYAAGPTLRIVEEYWERSAALMRQSGRAIEIIDYWQEFAPGGGEDKTALSNDARRNAAAMLDEQVSAPQCDDLDARLARAFLTWGEEGGAVLEAREHGWVAMLKRPRGRRMLNIAARGVRQHAQDYTHIAGQWSASRWEHALEVFGGKVPAKPSGAPVVRRSTLRDTLSLPASKSELPALYRLLFQLAPVEDRRFLVGRDRELAGIAQALKDWETGRFAACLIAGARGSGKTSLLNCAAAMFDGRTVIRGQFTQRLLTGEAMDDFLKGLMGLPAAADLGAALGAARRIVIIEETERIFLRRTGGFIAAEYLAGLVHRTAATTLWILVLNDKALRVLDSAISFGRSFSHRINAMNIARDDLEKAVLERHRLSGLRLDFAPPPAGDPRVSRVKRWLGIESAPQRLFFDSLYQQSEGVFRSAFELWLSSIERVEGETVRLRHPLVPAFGPFRSELSQDEQFTLLAIQEHGSLTLPELAEVRVDGEGACRTRLERLQAIGLVESDPEHPGLRVRPEAQRFVNDLLRRVNLY
jgi:AAA ATPase domain